MELQDVDYDGAERGVMLRAGNVTSSNGDVVLKGTAGSTFNMLEIYGCVVLLQSHLEFAFENS